MSGEALDVSNGKRLFTKLGITEYDAKAERVLHSKMELTSQKRKQSLKHLSKSRLGNISTRALFEDRKLVGFQHILPPTFLSSLSLWRAQSRHIMTLIPCSKGMVTSELSVCLDVVTKTALKLMSE